MSMTTPGSDSGFLEGQLLVAMPTMTDQRFERTVIYLISHTSRGAMGLGVNKPMPQLSFPALLEQVKIDLTPINSDIIIHSGGPVETGRGFVLHSADYVREATVMVGPSIALTATIDVLRAMAEGSGPRRALLALGYAGWGPGQLETEIQANAWLTVPADEGLIFGSEEDRKWTRAVAKLGIDLSHLSSEAGHA